MKKSSLLCAAVLSACVLSAQPSFQTSLQAGISLPLNSNEINATHAGKAIHFGNHLDYTFGNSSVRFGLGAYIGYINSIATDNKYKEVGESIAEKYGFNTAFLTFNASSFKSTHVLIGPVASFGSDKISFNIWAKGGYGLNEPSRYAVIYKENGVVNNNIYVNQGGENKNGLAYNAGAGVKLAISQYVGLQLSAGYFSTQTDQVNYNFDREKGTRPLYYTASNQFIQASAGLQFTIGNPVKKTSSAFSRSSYSDADTNPPINARPDQKIKTKSNIKNDRLVNNNNDNGTDPGFPINARPDQKIKTKSNIKNDRLANNAGDDDGDDADSDSLLFTPSKIELRSKISDAANRVQLQSVDNYLTGFVYQGSDGAMISQCGASAMPGEPIPGIDVKLKSINGAANAITARTNKDGSFAFNNVAAGDYAAEAGDTKMDVTVNGSNDNAFRTLDIMGGSCSSTKENYIINAGDKTYVEVISAREASSGMATGRKHIAGVKYQDLSTVTPRDAASGLATGKRMHKPYRVADTDFDINADKIYTSDGKLYAEVKTAREAGSGMATGRRSTIVTGDIDGDGIDEHAISSPRDAATGLATGRRMHKPFVITKELDATSNEIVSPRDAASGLPTGKRMHKPFVITKELDATSNEIVSPRDAASGMSSGRRMHKPFVITIQEADDDDAMAERDAATGLATGKRMHKPFVVGINPDEDSYEVISPRDAASGLPTGKRMHKPFVITKELDYNDDGEEIVTYRVIHRDLAARNVLLNEKGIITGKDNDNGMYAEGESGKLIAAWFSKKGYDYYKASAEDVVVNPLYQPSGNSGVNPLNAKTTGKMNSVQNNPLYESSGTQGENPLFESKSDLRVIGSNGITHDIFIPSKIIVLPVNNPPTEYSSYDVAPIKWMAPESIAARKSINEKGIKRSEAAKKGITEKGIKLQADNMEANAERKGWDGTVKGNSKNINTSEAGVGTGKGLSVTDAGNTAARKGWDGTVKGGTIVERVNRVNCIDGTCSVEAIITIDGAQYEAVITGVLKTKHDTAKNSVGNVR